MAKKSKNKNELITNEAIAPIQVDTAPAEVETITAEAEPVIAESTKRGSTASVTLTARGFLFNGASVALMGAPTHVDFEIDAEAKTMLVIPATSEGKHFSFATSEKRKKSAFITGKKHLLQIFALLGIQPEKGGISFTMALDNTTNYGIIDLTAFHIKT